MSLYTYQPRIADEMFDMLDELHPWDRTLAALHHRPHVPHFGHLALGGFGKDVEVHNTDKEFRVNLDLQHYSPEEVKISSDDTRITVNAKHEEKQDNHGFVSREVTRVFTLPENADPKSVTSSMNNRGRLAIRVQKAAIEPPKETSIPVEYKS